MDKKTHAIEAVTANKKSKARATTLTFSADDLSDLARLIGAGHVMMRMSFPIVGRIKAAMTRMGLPTKGM